MLTSLKYTPPQGCRVDAEEAHDQERVRQTRAGWRCRVLVVDDDEVVRAQLGALLREAGYEVRTAKSGADAVRLLGSTSCQILLTDWQMPDMDGIELCRIARHCSGEAYVYILMLTVRDSKEDLLQGLAAGADDFLGKGASPAELLARLEVARRITRLDYSLRKNHRQSLRLAVTDPLTGIHNRNYLLDHLQREIERARRYARPLAMLCCVIDEFKDLNDRLGHEAGDTALQVFVAEARSCMRDGGDWIARTGGDEFIVILPETTLGGATALAERLQARLSARIVHSSQGGFRFTVSIGVTAVESPDALAAASVDSLLRTVDDAAYASKRAGRNQVTPVPVTA